MGAPTPVPRTEKKGVLLPVWRTTLRYPAWRRQSTTWRPSAIKRWRSCFLANRAWPVALSFPPAVLVVVAALPPQPASKAVLAATAATVLLVITWIGLSHGSVAGSP